jgi:membrane-associated phospholipid phosphatase
MEMRRLPVLRYPLMQGAAPLPRERALLAGAALALAGYLLLVWWAASSTMALDQAARELVLLTRHPLLNRPMAEVSRLGAAEGIVALIGVGSLALWGRDRCWALVLPALMAGTGALQFLAKWSIDRPRPDLSPWGFPSGHVLSLVVFFGLLAYVGCASAKSGRRGILIALLCALPIVLVAYSRLYLDRHWLTDLAGGLTVGLAYLLLSVLIVEWARSRRGVRTRATQGPSRRL